VKRFLDQRPVLAAALFVVGLAVAVVAVVNASDLPTVQEIPLATVPAFFGAWAAGDGLRSLLRQYRARPTEA
jgi:hypothetical protein